MGIILRDVFFNDFLEETKHKNIVCIGLGDMFKKVIELQQEQFVRKITLLADNFSDEKSVNILNSVIPVTPITKLHARIDSKTAGGRTGNSRT